MNAFSILAAGDVGARRADLASMFRHVAPLFREAPVVFGQLETVISDRGEAVPNARLAMRAPAALAPVLADSGFTIMSAAGNHCLDFGYTAFADTLAHVRAAGIAVAGGGESRAAAYRPAYQSHGDTTVALVAASSILPEGYAAADRPGCAPLRAHTLYDQIEHDQPGTPARIRTVAHSEDLADLIAAVREAKAQADIVLVSLHWGIHMVRGSLAHYQIEVARAVAAAGADALLGHHPHIMKGIGFIDGVPIFYSLGNFALEQPHVWDPGIVETASFRHLVSLNPAWTFDKTYMLPVETRITGIARLVVKDRQISEVRFRPCWVEDDSAPRPVSPEEPPYDRVLAYLREVTAAEGLATRIEPDGEEFVLSPG